MYKKKSTKALSNRQAYLRDFNCHGVAFGIVATLVVDFVSIVVDSTMTTTPAGKGI